MCLEDWSKFFIIGTTPIVLLSLPINSSLAALVLDKLIEIPPPNLLNCLAVLFIILISLRLSPVSSKKQETISPALNKPAFNIVGVAGTYCCVISRLTYLIDSSTSPSPKNKATTDILSSYLSKNLLPSCVFSAYVS